MCRKFQQTKSATSLCGMPTFLLGSGYLQSAVSRSLMQMRMSFLLQAHRERRCYIEIPGQVLTQVLKEAIEEEVPNQVQFEGRKRSPRIRGSARCHNIVDLIWESQAFNDDNAEQRTLLLCCELNTMMFIEAHPTRVCGLPLASGRPMQTLRISFFSLKKKNSTSRKSEASYPITSNKTLSCSFLLEHGRPISSLSRAASRKSSLSCSDGTTIATTEAAAFTQEGLETFILQMQSSICDDAAAADGSGKCFGFDKWQRGVDAVNGYGITRVLEGGDLLEKAATNVSVVRGHLSEARAKGMSARGRGVKAGAAYFAGALSLVFHPCNPFVPTFRSDIRYFEVEGCQGWFGGGADLTPCYLFEEDARRFHAFYKTLCDKYSSDLYEESKATCDAYFYIPARKEHRGTGGIFFDDLEYFNTSPGHVKRASGHKLSDTYKVFAFVKEVAQGFMPSYLPIANIRRTLKYGERERQWQLLRRGRYLEFNLLYDRGVKFGLDGGRIESIMVSAPPLVAWKYNVIPEPDSREAELLDVLRQPQSWA